MQKRAAKARFLSRLNVQFYFFEMAEEYDAQHRRDKVDAQRQPGSREHGEDEHRDAEHHVPENDDQHRDTVFHRLRFVRPVVFGVFIVQEAAQKRGERGI